MHGEFGVEAMKQIGVLAVLAALLVSAPEASAQNAATDDIVERGGYGTTVLYTTMVKGVRITRGHLPEPASGLTPIVPIFEIAAPRFQALGNGLFYDSERNRLVDCFRRRGTQVGQVILRCVSLRFSR